MIDVKPPEFEGHHHTADCQWFECRLNNEIERLKAELANVRTCHNDEIADFNDYRAEAEERLATARALAMREVAGWVLNYRGGMKLNDSHDIRPATLERLARALTLCADSQAPLPASLVAVPRKQLTKVKSALGHALEWMGPRFGNDTGDDWGYEEAAEVGDALQEAYDAIKDAR